MELSLEASFKSEGPWPCRFEGCLQRELHFLEALRDLTCKLPRPSKPAATILRWLQILKASYKKAAPESPEGLQGLKLSPWASFKSEAHRASDLKDASSESFIP